MRIRRPTFRGREFGIEGIAIFGFVGYETVALAVNAATGKRFLIPITDLLGPLTHHRVGKVGVWLFLGYTWDHFYRKGERDIIEKLQVELTERMKAGY